VPKNITVGTGQSFKKYRALRPLPLKKKENKKVKTY
jgi:hypothetical protein